MTTSAPYIFRRCGVWVMRYRESINDLGTIKTVQRARNLCPDSVPKKQAGKLAIEEIKKLEQSRPAKTEMILPLGEFVNRVYLPFAETNLRFWTAKSYKVTWEKHFAARPKIAGMLLCTVHTSDCYSWLSEIVKMDKLEDGSTIGAATVKRLKSLLSGIFTLAVNLGYLNTPNPVKGTMLPDAPEPEETHAYTLEQIAEMIAALADPTARCMVAVAAFTGLSRSEIRGLTWEAIWDGEIHVLRGIVAGHVQETKTRARKAPVPLLPSLEQVLNRHRERSGNPVSGPIFRTATGNPIDPNNLLRDQLKPSFKSAKISYWSGWHGFRRGLASNLHRLGVQDKTIQGILRHSNVAVTQSAYIKTSNLDSRRALESLDAVLCSTCALESSQTALAVVK